MGLQTVPVHKEGPQGLCRFLHPGLFRRLSDAIQHLRYLVLAVEIGHLTGL